ncbi:YtxH domain-containing protein [Staphylococcus schleiferi]|uniref:YtxH domain-containing protein n=1 Tax=Staphylococcus sp. 191 TaxID=2070016 RepID=UPI0013F3C69F|nr:YtxH domain-containing protein [Staphylococcus sp. 191]NHA35836.1 YtxH domain-containing protein [Staphylococcus schleiferi]NHB71542.1 YtxH domain-containing protein [Staphylococcus sp. 191]
MAKSGKFLRAAIGIGSAVAAVVLSNKDNRDKLKKEYNKYKENPEDYKKRAQEKASQLGEAATQEFNKVKEDPKAYVNEAKQYPKSFINNKKEQLLNNDTTDTTDKRAAKFDDEGGGNPANNLRIVTEEELNNKNQS